MKYNNELMENLKNDKKYNYQDLDNSTDFTDYQAKKAITQILDETENLISDIKITRKDK